MEYELESPTHLSREKTVNPSPKDTLPETLRHVIKTENSSP